MELLKYRFTDFKNEKKVIDKITEMEKELSEESGKRVILVAYSGKEL